VLALRKLNPRAQVRQQGQRGQLRSITWNRLGYLTRALLKPHVLCGSNLAKRKGGERLSRGLGFLSVVHPANLMRKYDRLSSARRAGGHTMDAGCMLA
jgi:hypothetical protein